MPQRSYSVSVLQHKVEMVTVGGLIHANTILTLAKKLVINGHTLQLLHLDHAFCLGVSLTKNRKKRKPSPRHNIYLAWIWRLCTAHHSCVNQVKLLNRLTQFYWPRGTSLIAARTPISLIGVLLNCIVIRSLRWYVTVVLPLEPLTGAASPGPCSTT